MGLVDYCNKAPSRKKLLQGEIPWWIRSSPRGPYIASVMLSTPPWVKMSDLRELQRIAKRLTERTGVLHTLDHIVPLNHPFVCGLTVPWNLRVVPWRTNSGKSNKWCDGQLELFDNERMEYRPLQADLFSDWNKEYAHVYYASPDLGSNSSHAENRAPAASE